VKWSGSHKGALIQLGLSVAGLSHHHNHWVSARDVLEVKPQLLKSFLGRHGVTGEFVDENGHPNGINPVSTQSPSYLHFIPIRYETNQYFSHSTMHFFHSSLSVCPKFQSVSPVTLLFLRDVNTLRCFALPWSRHRQMISVVVKYHVQLNRAIILSSPTAIRHRPVSLQL
jgi:hypothetical protein